MPPGSIEKSWLTGFIKAASSPFNVEFHPGKLRLNYNFNNYNTPVQATTQVQYNNGASGNSAPSSVTYTPKPPPTYNSHIDVTPGQLKTYLGPVQNQVPQLYNAVSGWDKYDQFEKANPFKRLAGYAARPILSQPEQSAVRNYTDSYTTKALWDSIRNNPGDTSKMLGVAATTPSTAGTFTELAQLYSKLPFKFLPALRSMSVLGRASPALSAIGLVSGLANEAKELPQQIVDAGGYGNYLNNNSRLQSNWTTFPGYAANVFDNIGRPFSSITGVVNEEAGIINALRSAWDSARLAEQTRRRLWVQNPVNLSNQNFPTQY